MKPGNPWTLVQTCDEYRDFEQWLADNESGIGGVMRITLVDARDSEPSAYGSILWNSEDGEEIGVSDFQVTRAQAELILGDAVLSRQALIATAKGEQ